jgi:hypothetical protein
VVVHEILHATLDTSVLRFIIKSKFSWVVRLRANGTLQQHRAVCNDGLEASDSLVGVPQNGVGSSEPESAQILLSDPSRPT